MILLSSFISSLSICNRPGCIDDHDIPELRQQHLSRPDYRQQFVSPSIANTGMSSCLPSVCSCCTAAGRYKSAATNKGRLPCLAKCLANLAVVVLPEPCNPTIMITVGGSDAMVMLRWAPPIISVISSYTILTTCWASSGSPGHQPLQRGF